MDNSLTSPTEVALENPPAVFSQVDPRLLKPHPYNSSIYGEEDVTELNDNKLNQTASTLNGNGSPSILYPFTLLHISLKARFAKQRFERGQINVNRT
ncbi:hypothetical protein MC7420_4200 [Coleofasciculus chthonoplastes PCC 7420]|uniref:Uncharacterized protein n=1 Tax=Coleofasciculus chthonoplastes PCC 7420 TaxID=118168 RepID=B4VV64_9CYAN|nr:hypothetical protein [Coleofasciculus chthonoplastes]EDX74215.1 hypothetical protein MC7420_4200 [Coleofasciculus chthonoplastes PCC 7420]